MDHLLPEVPEQEEVNINLQKVAPVAIILILTAISLSGCIKYLDETDVDEAELTEEDQITDPHQSDNTVYSTEDKTLSEDLALLSSVTCATQSINVVDIADNGFSKRTGPASVTI